MTEKLALLQTILRIVWWFLKDSDGDGRPDLFDSEPDNPAVQ